jgi:manganese/zinc/iron transport system substrate-binding protein
VWFDVGLWKLATKVVIDTLIVAAPENAEGFRRRGALYLEELEALDQYCRERIAELPVERRVLITSHDAFRYFGKAYGFEVIGIQGISTESEAGLRRLADCVDLIRHRSVSAIFPESSVSPAAVQRVAQDSGARLGAELYSDALGPANSPAGTYRGMIRYNVDLIVEALRDSPP